MKGVFWGLYSTQVRGRARVRPRAASERPSVQASERPAQPSAHQLLNAHQLFFEKGM